MEKTRHVHVNSPYAILARRTTAGPVEIQTVEGAEERLASKFFVPVE